MARGPEAGLALLADLAQHDDLQSYFPYHAARADLYRRASRYAEAASDYVRALELAPSEPEKRFIARRLAEARARAR
jgi:RNA polymerase sigma-70 factor (ECF subfamily)